MRKGIRIGGMAGGKKKGKEERSDGDEGEWRER